MKSENASESQSESLITLDALINNPWDIWRHEHDYQSFLRNYLLIYLKGALQIRLNRSYIKTELLKRRSRKGAAVKRAFVASKNEANRLIELINPLELEQLWLFLDKQLGFGFNELESNLKVLLDSDISSIFKDTNILNNNNVSTLNDDCDSGHEEYSGGFSGDESQSVHENDEEVEQEHVKKKESSKKVSIDPFFNMKEMEKFADESFEDGDIDLFGPMGEESDNSVAAADMKYSDFFRDPEESGQDEEHILNCSTSLQGLDDDEKEMEKLLQQVENDYDDEEDNEENQDYSDVENEKIKMITHIDDDNNDFCDTKEMPNDEGIDKIESLLNAQRHWTLMGEATGTNRPRNSLLDVNLELPLTAQAQYEASNCNDELGQLENAYENGVEKSDAALPLELIIQQRINARVFDNVERKIALEDQLESIERLKQARKIQDETTELNFTKSNVGLGDVYAQRYQEHFMATDKLDGHKAKLTEDFAKLMYKLDSLCNYHIVPKITSEAEKSDTATLISVETPINVVTTTKDRMKGFQFKKTTRNSKKRKFNNKLKGLLNSGKIDMQQVNKIKESIKKRNKKRIDEAKQLKNVTKKHDYRLNVTQIMQEAVMSN